MRPSKIICLALGALNIAVFVASSAPRSDDGLKARVSLVPKSVEPSRAAVSSISFRPAGDYPEPAAAPNPDLVPIAAPDERLDDSSIAYLGSMTSAQGKTVYFFKNKATNRVYSTGGEGDGLVVISAAEKEFILEIDGKKYKVAR